jgi:tight adherence protein C
MTPPSSGPSIFGIDFLTIATVLSAVAAFCVLLALYAATTVRDPMARRVKALNERREQLKAGHRRLHLQAPQEHHQPE